MRHGNVVAFFFAAAGVAPAGQAWAAESSRPRGVGPEFAKFYTSPDTFSCISNPSIQIPKSRVNDDYCDCPDGSDEPGSSACSYLSPLSPQTHVPPANANVSEALPGFYCKNKGHNPNYISFTYINDGICDYEVCCDGSDEWQSVGGVKCPDKCAEIGKEWRRQEEQRQKSLTAAMRRRKELVNEAATSRREVEDAIKALKTEIEGSEMRVKQLEEEKQDIERRERSRVVKQPGSGGKAGVLAGLAKERLIELKEGIKDLMEQRNMYRERLQELEGVMSTFREEYNPNFNDEGVKRAVRAWDDYAARDKPEEYDGSLGRDSDYETITNGGGGDINWEEFEETNEPQAGGDIDVLYRFEEYLPSSVRSWVDKTLRDFRETLIKNGILAAPHDKKDAVDNKATQEAGNRLKSQQQDLDSQRRQLKEYEEDLAKDYGKDEVFRPLKGQCVSLDSGEYTYELCWMDKVTQKSKKGHSQNGMGNFARFETIMVDEALPADGKGLGTGERIALKYDNGAHCWNGPSRSTTVVLACAEKEEVWKVREEEKCVYRMEVGTPAVCEAVVKGNESPGAAAKAKDEL